MAEKQGGAKEDPVLETPMYKQDKLEMEATTIGRVDLAAPTTNPKPPPNNQL